jgi:GMP synthase (glutamine-hydrolysing)
MEEKILILDFGSQYTQLIARRIRELNVYCEIRPYNEITALGDGIKGVILSGSPFSVYDEHAPQLDVDIFRKNIPLLGVCYGAQWLAYRNGGNVQPSSTREYGRAKLNPVKESKLLQNLPPQTQVWMSHGDTITELPADFESICCTEDVEFAGFKIRGEETYGIQFHPEVHHSEHGKTLLLNFVTSICGCGQNWTPDAFVETSVTALQEQIRDEKVILAISGGVDSSVAAYLLHKAVGKNMTAVFVNNGLLRRNEYETVLETYRKTGLNVVGVDASALFYHKLQGVTDPEEKRKIIGKTFIEIFEQQAHKIQNVRWLAQGTIYPDVIESVSVKGPSATIKSHHNVGGLPKEMRLKIVEPLRLLFKDEVRRIGKTLAVPDVLLNRHPFPGPGLGIRILGDVTPEKVRILQDVDAIFVEHLHQSGWYDKTWQAAAILLPVKSVGVMGDERTYENCVALRAVSSTDGMTADWVRLPYDLLAKISSEIINKVKGVNRVVYDVSSKPPATIEWE